jgi:hypothetical protein
MNRCLLSRWEYLEGGIENLPNGIGLHLNNDEFLKFLSLIDGDYNNINLGKIECFVEDSLFEKLLEMKNIKLSEIELNNLINLEEIIIK